MPASLELVLPAAGLVSVVSVLARWVEEGSWSGLRAVGASGRVLIPAVLAIGVLTGLGTAHATLVQGPMARRAAFRVVDDPLLRVGLWPGRTAELGEVTARPERLVTDEAGVVWMEELLFVGPGVVGSARRARVVRTEEGTALEDPPPMPEALAKLLRRCFELEEKDRPRTFDEVAEGLLAVYRDVVDEDYPRQQPKAIDLQADNQNNRGVSLWDLGKMKEAEDAFEETLKLSPNHPRATFNLGLLASGHIGESIRSHTYYYRFFHGMIERASARGYHLLVEQDDASSESMPTSVQERKVDGLIIQRCSINGQRVAHMASTLPVVMLNCLEAGADVPSVLPDNADGMAQCVHHLYERGHRRIAYFGIPGPPVGSLHQGERRG